MAPEAAAASSDLSRYDAMLRLAKALGTHRTLADLVHVLADYLHSLIAFDYLALVLHDEQQDAMRLVVLEPSDFELPFQSKPVAEHGPAATVWEKQRGAVIPVPENGPLPPVLDALRREGLKMTCWLPLTTSHRRVGVLAFGSRSGQPYTDDVLAFTEQIAGIVAIAVENGINREDAQQYDLELREERDRLQFILDVNNLLVSRLDYRALLEAICETVQRIVEADQIGVALWHEESAELRFDVIYDKSHGFTTPSLSLPLDASAAGVTFQQGVPALYRRAELEGLGWGNSVSLMKATGVESLCCVPLATRKGKLGVLMVGSAKPDAFSEGDVNLLGHASAQIAIAIDNARAYERVASLNSQLIDEKQYLERELRQDFGDIVGVSPAVQQVLQAVRTVAPTDSTVLILGETGTGKELIARAIHDLSPRRGRSFVRTSVAALPETLLESELFGHEKGAFTGATAGRAGRLELANRGTLFLDEVGDIPAEMQPKLLRVLQEREFERLGSAKTQRVDVRVVAATNRDLERMAEEGTFRSDLFYRLNVFPITMPPLRDRAEDIPALARHFAGLCARRMGRPVPTIPPAALQALQQWKWPGNIRELQNVIERAVILTTGPTLQLPFQDLQPKTRRAGSAPTPKPAPTLKDAERAAILSALRESGGVIAGPTGAAARLGLQRTTLHSKMRKLGIERPSY
jgi:formate hydrogenlyase transcriptional activator